MLIIGVALHCLFNLTHLYMAYFDVQLLQPSSSPELPHHSQTSKIILYITVHCPPTLCQLFQPVEMVTLLGINIVVLILTDFICIARAI